MLQPEGLRGDPQSEDCEAEAGAGQERARGRGEVEGEEDGVPEEVLGGADFVEGDEGEGLGEHGCREVLFGEEEGQGEGGEEELGEEGEGF